MLALILAGAVALAATGAPPAWAGPAQEEYRLQLPDARGDGGSGSPSEARARLGGSSPSPSVASGSSLGGGSYPSDSSTGSQAGGSPDRTSSADGDSSSYDDALLAKARADSGGSGLLSAGTSAAGKAPALAVLAAVLLITLAGLLAVRRSRRRKGLSSG